MFLFIFSQYLLSFISDRIYQYEIFTCKTAYIGSTNKELTLNNLCHQKKSERKKQNTSEIYCCAIHKNSACIHYCSYVYIYIFVEYMYIS